MKIRKFAPLKRSSTLCRTISRSPGPLAIKDRAIPRRGDVWWVKLDPTLGSEINKTRPCLVLTSDIVNERRRTIVVVPLSSSPQANPPLLVSVVCAGRDVVAVIDQIRAVSKERLDRHMGTISTAHLDAVEDGLRQILELN